MKKAIPTDRHHHHHTISSVAAFPIFVHNVQLGLISHGRLLYNFLLPALSSIRKCCFPFKEGKAERKTLKSRVDGQTTRDVECQPW